MRPRISYTTFLIIIGVLTLLLSLVINAFSEVNANAFLSQGKATLYVGHSNTDLGFVSDNSFVLKANYEYLASYNTVEDVDLILRVYSPERFTFYSTGECHTGCVPTYNSESELYWANITVKQTTGKFQPVAIEGGSGPFGLVTSLNKDVPAILMHFTFEPE
ncbi:MAG: hypothetical protein ACOZAO_03410 [Patescibacteria group bacterium]